MFSQNRLQNNLHDSANAGVSSFDSKTSKPLYTKSALKHWAVELTVWAGNFKMTFMLTSSFSTSDVSQSVFKSTFVRPDLILLLI